MFIRFKSQLINLDHVEQIYCDSDNNIFVIKILFNNRFKYVYQSEDVNKCKEVFEYIISNIVDGINNNKNYLDFARMYQTFDESKEKSWKQSI